MKKFYITIALVLWSFTQIAEVTHNGERNLLKISNGIYLLKAMDANGTQIIKKTVVL